MRCYELETHISQEKDGLVQLRLKDSQHQARNEAMKVLEESVSGNLFIHACVIKKSLEACTLCDFSGPSMAGYLKKENYELRTVFENQESTEKAHNYRTNAKPT